MPTLRAGGGLGIRLLGLHTPGALRLTIALFALWVQGDGKADGLGLSGGGSIKM